MPTVYVHFDPVELKSERRLQEENYSILSPTAEATTRMRTRSEGLMEAPPFPVFTDLPPLPRHNSHDRGKEGAQLKRTARNALMPLGNEHLLEHRAEGARGGTVLVIARAQHRPRHNCDDGVRTEFKIRRFSCWSGNIVNMAGGGGGGATGCTNTPTHT